MKTKFLLALLFVFSIGISLQWTGASAYADTHSAEMVKKKKKKKKKDKKPKKKKSKKQKEVDPKKEEKRKAKEKKKKEKRKAEQEKQAQKLHEERVRKKEKLAKQQEKSRGDYSHCDSADVVRTSKDSLLLAKYIKVYRGLGGICYIIHLQEMGRLENTSEGHYYVEMRASKDPRAPADWQTYLYCPIGKPNGLVALVSPVGDTIQTCTYQNEMKEGVMRYYKNKKVFYEEKYVSDNKVSAAEIKYEGE